MILLSKLMISEDPFLVNLA